MFSYYGSKHRIAGLYPPPQTSRIIEPFAGSAAYACRYYRRDVLLIDANPKVAGVWDYLIRATSREIRTLPLLGPEDGVDALGSVPEEARALVGFWLAKGRAHPAVTPSAWRKEKFDIPRHAAHFWGEKIRERIAFQIQFIRHWKARCANFWEAPDVVADWFIDPPYQGKAGLQYRRYGSRSFDYPALAAWSLERRGNIMVCENSGADWLPFQPFHRAAGMQGTKRTGVSHEILWHRPLYTQASLFEVA